MLVQQIQHPKIRTKVDEHQGPDLYYQVDGQYGGNDLIVKEIQPADGQAG